MLPTYQAVIFAVLTPLITLFPVDRNAHFYLIDRVLEWRLTEAQSGVLLLAIACSLFLYFIHDWASLISSALRIIFTAQAPKSIDERTFFFLLISQIPVLLFFFYGNHFFPETEAIPLIISLLVFSFILFISNRMNRKRKTYLDWSLVDSLILGISQLTAFIPGAGRQIGALTAGFLRNYTYEAVLKFCCLSFTPWLFFTGFYAIGDFQSISSTFEMELWTFVIFLIASIVSTFFTISSFMKLSFKQSVNGFILYRVLLAIAIGVLYFL